MRYSGSLRRIELGAGVLARKISYSLYLWQELFCSNANLHYGYVLALPAIGCACLSYYLVEQFMLRIRERISGKAVREAPSSGALVSEPVSATGAGGFAA